MAGRFSLSADQLALLHRRLDAEGLSLATLPTRVARVDPTMPVPLSQAQRRIWVLDHLADHPAAYVIPSALLVEGPLRRDLLARAAALVAERHRVLRSVVVDGPDGPLMAPGPGPEVSVRTGVAGLSDEANVAAWAHELSARPFELSRGPLVRLVVGDLGPTTTAIVMCLHHLVADRWSMGVLYADLLEAYAAASLGAAPAWAPLEVDYLDLAAAHATEGGTPDQAGLDYWASTLAGSRPGLDLPFDRDRPASKTYRGSSVPVRVPRSVGQALGALARAERTSVFALLMAGLHILLARVGDNPDIVVGTPVANRGTRQAEALVGPFVNTIAVRARLTREQSVADAARAVSDALFAGLRHQHVPFDEVAQAVSADRSAAHTPVFDVLISFQNVPVPQVPGGGVTIRPVALEAPKAEFDLLLDLADDDGEITGRLEFSTDVFERDTASMLAAAYTEVVTALATTPDIAVGSVPLGIAEAADGGAAPEPLHLGLRLVSDADADPDVPAAGVPALVVGRRRVARRQVDTAADALAGWLVGRGLGAGSTVGLAMPASPEAVIALLAVLRAGARYAVLAPAPLDSAGVDLVLVQRAGDVDGVVTSGPVVAMDQLADEVLGQGADPGSATQRPDSAFTRGVLATVSGLQQACPLTPGERVVSQARWSDVDPSVQVLWPLLAGATVVLPRDVAAGRDAVAGHGPSASPEVDVVIAPYPVAGTLPPGDAAASPEAPRAARVLRPGAASAPAGLATSHDILLDARGAFATRAVHGARVADWRPLAGVRVEAHSPAGHPLPRGVPGRLRVRRTVPGVEPDVLVEAWSDPVCRGRVLGGGFTLEPHPGRLLRRRGFVVSLDDLADRLAAHPQVREVAVDADGGVLRAVLVGDPGVLEAVGPLLAQLPDYAVPDDVRAVDSFTRLADGSLVWQEREPEPGRPAAGDDAVADPDPLAAQLADEFARVLGQHMLAADTDFFVAGGHSIAAAQLAARLRVRLRQEVSLRDVFDHPSPRRLAQRLRSTAGELRERPEPSVGGRREGPLTFWQQGLAQHHAVPLDDVHHNVVLGVRVTGLDEVTHLTEALDDLLARHPALRTALEHTPDGWAQRVAEPTPWPVRLVDAVTMSAAARERLVGEAVTTLRETVIPTDEPPLVRALVVAGRSDVDLVVAMHHAVTDNWTFGLLLADLADALSARRRGSAPGSAGDPGLTTVDLAEWQQLLLASGHLDDDLAYWRAVLADLPRPRALVARLPGAAQAPSGFELDAVLLGGLRAVAERTQASLFVVLLAAFQCVQAWHSDDERVVTAYPDGTRQGTETIAGYFVQHPVVLTRVGRGDSFVDVVRAVRAGVLDAREHAAVPAWMALPAGRSGAELTRVMVNLLNAPVGAFDVDGVHLQPLARSGAHVFDEVVGEVDAGAVDLALVAREVSGSLRGMWLHGDDPAARSVARCFPAAVGALVESPHDPLATVWQRVSDLLDDTEDTDLVEETEVSR